MSAKHNPTQITGRNLFSWHTQGAWWYDDAYGISVLAETRANTITAVKIPWHALDAARKRAAQEGQS